MSAGRHRAPTLRTRMAARLGRSQQDDDATAAWVADLGDAPAFEPTDQAREVPA